MTAKVQCYYKINQFLAVKLHFVVDITIITKRWQKDFAKWNMILILSYQ